MQVYQLGEGTPEVAVVAGIHGDEPCGPRGVEQLLATEPTVDRPVKLIVANEEALERGVRYLDDDLNRSFPGSADATSHERRLAYDLVNELRDCTVLALHSTQSTPRPFAVADSVDAVARAVCPHLPVELLVETAGFAEGRLIDHAHTIEVECGLQGSDEAAENAYDLIRGFLAATGVLPAPESTDRLDAGLSDEVTVFRLADKIPKPPADEYEVFATNFEPVSAGDRFAAYDGEDLVAEVDFYPVLLSPYGYPDLFGYTAERVGTLD